MFKFPSLLPIRHLERIPQIEDAAGLLENMLTLDVTYSVLFGTSKPRLHSTPPISGLHPHDIALALFLVR